MEETYLGIEEEMNISNLKTVEKIKTKKIG